MRFLSVCSGIEAASVAWRPLGWEAAALSEIDPFACHVLHHRQGASRPLFMPSPEAGGLKLKERRSRAAAIRAVQRLPETAEVPNFGDMTKFKDWPDVPDVSILVGGTPCQSFSVAGLRKGMDDPRGNLALTYLAIADRYRPKWVVWENVPGVLSSNGGRDFGAFLGGLGQLGYGFSYRVLDAQYVRARRFPFAAPQRRRRVFVVGYLGDWRRAAAVLFDRQSMRGDPAPRRAARQGLAVDVAPSLVSSGRGVRTAGETRGQDPVIAARMVAFGEYEVDGSASAMKARDYKDATDLVAAPHVVISPDPHRWAVRRLTPIECERLQSFPDDYTRIPWHRKPASKCPDGPRYKTLGNSMAGNVMDFLGERIDLVEKIINEGELTHG